MFLAGSYRYCTSYIHVRSCECNLIVVEFHFTMSCQVSIPSCTLVPTLFLVNSLKVTIYVEHTHTHTHRLFIMDFLISQPALLMMLCSNYSLLELKPELSYYILVDTYMCVSACLCVEVHPCVCVCVCECAH